MAMLSETERKTLQYHRLDDMNAKARGNMYYRIRQKLKDSVDYLRDMNLTLAQIDKNHIQDGLSLAHLDEALKLTEKMIRVLDISPVERQRSGVGYVTRTIEYKQFLDEDGRYNVTERRIRSEVATREDEQKAQMVLDHIDRLQRYMTLDDAERSPYRR